MSATSATLEDAIRLAVEAHQGQKDKVGQPYILHPLRVMFRLRTDDERMAGVLHDVVEDTPQTLDDLRGRGFSDQVVAAVECLTKREGETYDDFMARVRTNPLARRVKLADLEDNMDVLRLPRVTEKDRERLDRYRQAHALLVGST